ncbi:hypothetical protein BC830DRAFT_1155250 [Chytriomyces sp. MP71]|nr:hypothetical protein BC830DRAFT_1155250 [Chytriomyces sp. MP71]
MDAWAYKNIQAHHIATFMMDLNSVAEVEQLDPHPDPAICKFRAACLSIPPLQEAVVLINQISIIDHKDPDAVKKFFKQFTLGTNLINLCIEIQDRHKVSNNLSHCLPLMLMQVQIALEIFRRDTEGYMEELMEQVAQQLDKINFKDHGTDY